MHESLNDVLDTNMCDASWAYTNVQGGGGLVFLGCVCNINFLRGHEKCIDILDTSTVIYSQHNTLLGEIFSALAVNNTYLGAKY